MAYAKNDCLCGCGGKCQGEYIRGHRPPEARRTRRTIKEEQQAAQDALIILFDAAKPEKAAQAAEEGSGFTADTQEPEPAEPKSESFTAHAQEPEQTVHLSDHPGPPVHPAPIDQRRWRLGTERPNTPKDDPWLETRCHECRLPMWTRDPASTWENGGMCVECDYIMRSELATHGRQQFRHQARTYHDPFRPR